METRSLVGSGVQLSVLGQGTWQISARGAAADEAIEALRRGIELGMTHIDTAEMYGNGDAEKLVGRLLRDGGVRRDQVILASKVLPQNASYGGTLEACDRSLRRLGTDVLDLYMLHWPGSHPIAETMRALEKLVDDGRVRALGVSNFDVEELEAARGALRHHPLAFNQVLYHLQERSIELNLIPHCEKHGILVVGYSPFGQDRFPTGPKLRVLEEIGKSQEKTARQVALNFLTRKPITVSIPKSQKQGHTEENSGGAGWRLDDDEVQAIDRAFPLRVRRELPML